MTIYQGNQREISINLDVNAKGAGVMPAGNFRRTAIKIEGFDPGSE